MSSLYLRCFSYLIFAFSDSLSKVFQRAITEVPSVTWESIYICYPADSQLETFIIQGAYDSEAQIDDIRDKILTSKTELSELLAGRVDELRFLEIRSHCFFGGFFGWREEGGYM